MSDTKDDTLKPVPDTDLSIIERSVVMNFRQPVNAARTMMLLLRKCNAALGRVAELEKQVAELKAGAEIKIVPGPPQKSTQPPTSPKPSTTKPSDVI